MPGEDEDITSKEERNSRTNRVPLSLREFGEVPRRLISVFTVVPKDQLEEISKEGLLTEKNPRASEILKDQTEDPRMARIVKVEQIFYKVALEFGLEKFDRASCIFAYPRHPSKVRMGMSFDPETQAILELKVDPETIVANGEYVTEASVDLQNGEDEEMVREWAERYWDESIPLFTYIKEHNGADDDYTDFTFPEVLIPYNVDTSKIKLNSPLD